MRIGSVKVYGNEHIPKGSVGNRNSGTGVLRQETERVF